VCEAYFANCPSRTGYLRADALALLLSLANVAAHARVLVVEGCGGLVLAAAAERLGGHGGVVAAWPGAPGTKQPSLSVWRQMNLSPPQRDTLRFAPLHELQAERLQQHQQQQQEGAQPPAVQPGDSAQAAEAAGQPPQQQQQQAEGSGGSSTAAPMEVGSPEGAASEAQQAQQAQLQAQAAGEGSAPPGAGGPQAPQPASPQQLQRPPFTSCILAAPALSPLALIRAVLPLMAPSSALAVYSPWQQPLAEALDALRGQGQVAGLVLQETWWREMQVRRFLCSCVWGGVPLTCL
jgi:tRNA (adenine-N(1)-)-methyltransferase non-catalytic subunit